MLFAAKSPSLSRKGSMTLLEAMAAAPQAQATDVPGLLDGSQPTIDESLESLDSSYQGFYKELPNQIWSSPPRSAESSSAPSPEPTAASPSSTAAAAATPHSSAKPASKTTTRSQGPAVVSPPQQHERKTKIIPFAGQNAGLPGNGDAVRHLQHELKFARQEIRELKQRLEQKAGPVTDVASVAAIKDDAVVASSDEPVVPPEILVQPVDTIQLFHRLETSEARVTKLTQQLRDSNIMAAKLYRSLHLARVRFQEWQEHQGRSVSLDMGLIVQQSQWLRFVMLVAPVLLLLGHVELFAVLVLLSWITLEVATSE